jgi:DUF971 family protein
MSDRCRNEYKPYITDKAEWIYPHEKAPPKGVKLNILTEGGVAITGDWAEGVGFLGWQYLFKRNMEKEEVYIAYMKEQGKRI